MAKPKDEKTDEFKIVDVKPEDLEDTKPEGTVSHSAWVAADAWPGSASRTEAEARSQSAWIASDTWPGSAAPRNEVQNEENEITFIAKTTVRFPSRDRRAGSAWIAADAWPGSAASTDSED